MPLCSTLYSSSFSIATFFLSKNRSFLHMDSASTSQQYPRSFSDALRDIALWRRRKESVGTVLGATAIWVLFEVYQFNFVTLVAWVAMAVVVILFLWGSTLRLLNKESPSTSGLEISERSAMEAASVVRQLIEEGIRWIFHVVAEEHFYVPGVVVCALWFLSYIGSLFDLTTFLYIGTVLGMSAPVIYVKYEKHIRKGGEKMKEKGTRVCEMVDEKVIKKLKDMMFKEKKEKKAE